MTSFEPLKSVEKTLAVLERLNKSPIVKVRDIAHDTNIPMPTVVRILETLVGSGYVRQLDRRSGYFVTSKVLGLSAGCHGLSTVFDDACAAAEAITKTFLWPAAIATLDGDAMVVRYSTIPHSPLSHKHSTINRRLSLTKHGHGRAYLAFCPEEEREHLIGLLEEALPKDRDADDLRAEVADIVRRTRKSGFGQRDVQVEPDTTTLAVPIRVGGRVAGTLGVTFFRNVRLDLQKLRDALKQAEKSLTR